MNLIKKGNKITIKPSYEEERQKYIKLIQDANLLGEFDEVERLQEEWTKVKVEYEKK